MTTSIPWINLLWCLIPLLISAAVFKHQKASVPELSIAWIRMALQLILVGFALVLLFDLNSPVYMLIIFLIMTAIAAWIAIRPVSDVSGLWLPALSALLIAAGLHLILSLVAVLESSQWYEPRLLIPLAGMYLANTMNSISLSAERYLAELNHQNAISARNTAFSSAMIPQINGLLAVGLVALPGMMTGQILSGVSPLIAVRYQVMIMAMVFGCSALGCWLFLHLFRPDRSTPDAG